MMLLLLLGHCLRCVTCSGAVEIHSFIHYLFLTSFDTYALNIKYVPGVRNTEVNPKAKVLPLMEHAFLP